MKMVNHNILMIVPLLLCLICVSPMYLPKEEVPFRSKAIVQAIAAHTSIGTRLNQKTKVIEYDNNVPFVKVLSQFLQKYVGFRTINNDRKRSFESYAHAVHVQNIGVYLKKVSKTDPGITEDQEEALASQLLAQLDQYYFNIYGIETEDPDKYMGLIGIGLALFDKQLKAYTHVLRRHPIEKMPKTYQYFHQYVRQDTSQFDQDGVIEAIFQLIGTRNKFFVEVGGGSENDNTYRLRTTEKWDGNLFNSGTNFVTTEENYKKMIYQMVTPLTAVDIFKKYNIPKELDFLSIDVDSNDFWLAKEILREYRPAVISAEFNSNFPVQFSGTILNCQPTFEWLVYDKVYGASAKSYTDLAAVNGYSYVYHMAFTDIFLVRNDLLPVEYQGMRLEDTYDSYPIHHATLNMKAFEHMNITDPAYKYCGNLPPAPPVQRSTAQKWNIALGIIVVALGLALFISVRKQCKKNKQRNYDKVLKQQGGSQSDKKGVQLTSQFNPK